MNITLPKYVFEEQLSSFVGRLSQRLDAHDIYLDFENIKHYIPAAIVAIIACVRKWRSEGKRIYLTNHKGNDAFRYLQRIDFFSTLGLNYEEDFRRHAPLGDFVTITEVSAQKTRDVEPLIRDLVGTLVPENEYEDLFRLLQYALGEIIRNCMQHSNGVGFVAAQYAGMTDLIRIGIADHGIGIRESFKSSDSPHFKEEFSDSKCLELALKPEISSKTHIKGPYGDPSNAGVGLSIVQAIAAETAGYFFLASGSASYLKNGQKTGEFADWPGRDYRGTVVSVAFSRKQVYNYADILMDAKRRIGLVSNEIQSAEGLFE